MATYRKATNDKNRFCFVTITEIYLNFLFSFILHIKKRLYNLFSQSRSCTFKLFKYNFVDFILKLERSEIKGSCENDMMIQSEFLFVTNIKKNNFNVYQNSWLSIQVDNENVYNHRLILYYWNTLIISDLDSFPDTPAITSMMRKNENTIT